MITQDVSKDEKQGGVKGPILGNCKVFWVENGQAPKAQGQAQPAYQQQAPQQQAAPQMAPAYQQPPARQAPPTPQQPATYGTAPAGHEAPKDPAMDFDDDIPF